MRKLLYWLAIIIIWLGWMMILAACSPSQRMARILKNNPELLTQDTVTIIDTISIAAINISASAGIDTTTNLLDSVLSKIDLPNIDKENIRYIFRTKKLLADTFKVTQGDVLVKIWQANDELNVIVTKEKEIIIRTVKAPCPDLVYKLSKWQQFRLDAFWFMVILILLLSYFAARIISRKESA